MLAQLLVPQAHPVVQVRTGRAARVAHRPDLLPALYLFTLHDHNFIQVAVFGLVATLARIGLALLVAFLFSMGNNNCIAEVFILPSIAYKTIRRRVDGRPSAASKIDAPVEGPTPSKGINAPAKGRRPPRLLLGDW